jgi:hypothetical protein
MLYPIMNIEELRLSFKQQKVSVLFVGESAPANRGFFYKGDSGLFSATMEVFTLAGKGPFLTKNEFLDYFRDHDYFLDDICHEPVNDLVNTIRLKKGSNR